MSAGGGFRRSHAANACETILSNQRFFAWCRMAAPAFVPDASYERALGAFTAEWAYAEAAVDMCNLVVLEAYGGRAIGDHLPTTIEERIDFFRKAHRTLPLLASYARGGLPLIGRFAALRYDRHSLVTEAKRFTEGEIDAKAAEAADIAAGLLAPAVALARAAAAAEPLVANGP